MTTKEQERKALAKIREIAEGLGPDSYVLTAFKGAFELAEENIDNDFACSMEDYVNREIKAADAVRKELNDAHEKIKELEIVNNTLTGRLADMVDAKASVEDDRSHCLERIRELEFTNSDMVIQNKDLSDEIVRLKARLYDLLYAHAS